MTNGNKTLVGKWKRKKGFDLSAQERQKEVLVAAVQGNSYIIISLVARRSGNRRPGVSSLLFW